MERYREDWLMTKSDLGNRPNEFVVFATLSEAGRVTDLSEQQIRAWHAAKILTPFLVRETSRGAQTRLFDFVDLVSLGILARFRGKVSTDELRKVQGTLRGRAQHEWNELRLVIGNGRLNILDDVDHEGTRGSDATWIDVGRLASDLRREIDRSRTRGPEVVGKIVRDPAVMGGAWVIAGTRIPTETIWSFHESGYDTEAIIEQYPRLRPDDVVASIAHERQLRAQGAA
jgi:uncharacterized protein (DUF433 family)/DNA-binding transcriptional MerR regulator